MVGIEKLKNMVYESWVCKEIIYHVFWK